MYDRFCRADARLPTSVITVVIFDTAQGVQMPSSGSMCSMLYQFAKWQIGDVNLPKWLARFSCRVSAFGLAVFDRG